jgi:hypothetical protein
MILRRSRDYSIISAILFFLFFINSSLFSQKNLPSGMNPPKDKFNFRIDSGEDQQKPSVVIAEPDTNFTWEKYAAFLNKISDTSRYIVLPLNEFRQTFNPRKIIIGLRHDVDNDLNIAYKFSQIESNLGFRSTYFILHSAPYYLVNVNNMEVHSNEIIPILKSMQNEKHFEIGWHNDLVTLQVIYNINPVTFFHSELNWLRSNGIKIYGTAAHGSSYCKTYHYLNYYFFEECSFPVVLNRENNIFVPRDGKSIKLIKGKLSDFGLQYEAYFLNNNKAFSDATVTNGIRWNIGMLDLSQLQPGDRAIVLLHPIHWHKASVLANIDAFSIRGQKSSTIDTINHVITVEMPSGTNRASLVASFTLSPGAYAKISGKMQFARNTLNNFNKPVIYKVYAENRSVHQEWTVRVINKRNRADFVSFAIPGMKGKASIDTVRNIINAEIYKNFQKDSLKPSFVISDNSSVWIDMKEQISDSTYIKLSAPVEYTVVSRDSLIIKKWHVNISSNESETEDDQGLTGLRIYPNPTGGKAQIQFTGVKASPSRVEIFDTMGNKVFTKEIRKTGKFTVVEDLRKLNGGVYTLRYSEIEKPQLLVIKQH